MKKLKGWFFFLIFVLCVGCFFYRRSVIQFLIYHTHEVVSYEDAKDSLTLTMTAKQSDSFYRSYDVELVLKNNSNKVIEHVRLGAIGEFHGIETYSGKVVANYYNSDTHQLDFSHIGFWKHGQSMAIYPHETLKGHIVITFDEQITGDLSNIIFLE